MWIWISFFNGASDGSGQILRWAGRPRYRDLTPKTGFVT